MGNAGLLRRDVEMIYLQPGLLRLHIRNSPFSHSTIPFTVGEGRETIPLLKVLGLQTQPKPAYLWPPP